MDASAMRDETHRDEPERLPTAACSSENEFHRPGFVTGTNCEASGIARASSARPRNKEDKNRSRRRWPGIFHNAMAHPREKETRRLDSLNSDANLTKPDLNCGIAITWREPPQRNDANPPLHRGSNERN